MGIHAASEALGLHGRAQSKKRGVGKRRRDVLERVRICKNEWRRGWRTGQRLRGGETISFGIKAKLEFVHYLIDTSAIPASFKFGTAGPRFALAL